MVHLTQYRHLSRRRGSLVFVLNAHALDGNVGDFPIFSRLLAPGEPHLSKGPGPENPDAIIIVVSLRWPVG